MSSKSNKKKKHRKSFKSEARKRDAEKWLSQQSLPDDLILSYAERYDCSESDAHVELMEIGYKDEVDIQYYEKEGIEWEYKYDGYTGEMHVVPKGTEDWELNEYD